MNSNIYAFIDGQNLNLGVKNQGWEIDYRKFRLYLRSKYNVSQAFLFIGLVQNNQHLYTMLQKAGFVLVFKPTVKYFADGIKTVKGNVDAELVLHASAIEYDNYNKAILVTSDGDFSCLVEFLKQKEKLLHIITPNKRYSTLLKKYSSYIIDIGRLKNSIERTKNTSIGGRSKP